MKAQTPRCFSPVLFNLLKNTQLLITKHFLQNRSYDRSIAHPPPPHPHTHSHKHIICAPQHSWRSSHGSSPVALQGLHIPQPLACSNMDRGRSQDPWCSLFHLDKGTTRGNRRLVTSRPALSWTQDVRVQIQAIDAGTRRNDLEEALLGNNVNQ